VKIFASLYLDEDMNNMVATLLRSRGIDAVNLTHSGIIVVPQKSPYEIVNRVMILLDSMTADEIANQLLYV